MEEIREQTNVGEEKRKKKKEHIALTLAKKILFSSILILFIGFVSYMVLLAIMMII